MTNTALLNEIITRSGFKRSFIARKIGVTTYGLARKINNENEFKASEINALCELLRIESLELRDRVFFAVK